ncbi:MAG: Gfo/Idh/MocA family oxidoreductase [Pseudomonadota bacterium]
MTEYQIGLVGSGRVADRLGAALLIAENVALKPVRTPPQFISESGLHALIVAENTPDNLILAGAALEAGLCVFVGALAGMTLEQLIELRRAEFSANKTCLKFGFPIRHHESFMAASEFVAAEDLGPLLTARGVYGTSQPLRDRRGAMVQHGYEMIDLLHAFAGPFETVNAMIGHQAWPVSRGEDNVMALLRTHDGVMVSLHASTTTWRHTFRLELTYANGYVWLDGLNKLGGDLGPEMLITARAARDESGQLQANPPERVREFGPRDISAAQIDEFLALVRGTRPIQHGTSQQAFDVLNTAERILAADPTWFPPQGD